MKVIFESSNNKDPRIITGDPMKFFVGNKIVNGHFVSVGYFIPQDAKNPGLPTFGARTKKVNIPANDEMMQEYIERYAGTPFGAALEAIRNSPKYQTVLATGDNAKQVPFDLMDSTLIKIGRYNLNWRDHAHNAAEWGKRYEKVHRLRAKYGFGDFGNWTEDSWHNKPEYGGTGIYPRLESMPEEGRRWPDQPADEDMTQEDVIEFARRGRYDGKTDKQVSAYKGVMGDLWMDKDSNIAIRQNLASSKYARSFFYFVSPDGSMQEIDEDCINWLCNAYKRASTKKAPEVAQLEADEAEFLKELAKLEDENNRQIKTILLDRVLYIVGTIQTPGKRNFERIAYVNDTNIYSSFPYLDRDELHRVLPDWIKESTRDVIELDSAATTGEFTDPAMNEAVKRAVKREIHKAAKMIKENASPYKVEYPNLSSYLMDTLDINPDSDWATATDRMREAIADTARPEDVDDIMKLLYTPNITIDPQDTYDIVTVRYRKEVYELSFMH